MRCALQNPWFAAAPKQANDVTAFVDNGVIGKAKGANGWSSDRPPNTSCSRHYDTAAVADDFGGRATTFPAPLPNAASGPLGPTNHNSDFAPVQEPAPLAVTDAPPLVPPIEHAPLPDADSASLDTEDLESFAARRQRLKAKRQIKRRSSRWTAIALVLFSFNVALVGARSEVVR